MIHPFTRGGRGHSHGTGRRAFSLVELMMAIVILSGIMLVVLGITQQISSVWQKSSARIESFRGARASFQSISRQVGQATLNTYYDYYENGVRRTPANAATFSPTSYGRQSDLHFICGKALVPGQTGHAVFFQAPLGETDSTTYQGLDGALNACGYYITYGPDVSRPAFIDALPNAAPARNRFRLMQLLQPTQNLGVYHYTSAADQNRWFTEPLAAGDCTQQIAENVLVMVVLPKPAREDAAPDSLAPAYEYDTRNMANAQTMHQLPPVVEVVLVAIDETSAARLGNTAAPPDLGLAALFQNAANLESDLITLTKSLDARHITYRVFRSAIALRGAKWSS